MKEPNNLKDSALLDALAIDPRCNLSKSRQLYLNLYDCICRGLPGQGALLPPSRRVAQHLRLGRNTVTQVYEQLASEGLLEGRGRAGTRVVYAGTVAVPDQAGVVLGSRAQAQSRMGRPRAFSPGEPDAALFPQRDWTRALARAARGDRERWGYVRDNGHPGLCESIARFLAQYRGLHVSPSRIMITAGTRQSLNLAAMLYASPGDVAWVEEPGYGGAVAAWQSQGLSLVPCPVDEQGMCFPASPPPRLIYTTPCFHYPLGVTLSADRRDTLLARAAACGAVIFEDDYDSEFRDQYQPRPALAGDASAAVLHAGTFSKLMFPSVRIAWLVLPETHVPAACRALADIGGGHNSVVQEAVATLLDEGAVARHLSRARQVYAQRRRVLLQVLDQHAPVLRYRDGTGGLSLIVDLARALDRNALEQSLEARGLGAIALESLLWSGDQQRGCKAVVLGLGNVASMDIPRTVQSLRDAVDAVS